MGIGGCATAKEIGVYDLLAKHNTVHWHWTDGEGARKLGLTVQELPLVKKKMVNALEAGNPIILSLGKGDFTTTGHYIVLAGEEEGLIRVNDPNSPIRSQRLWTYEELESQIRNIWAMSPA